MHYLPSTEWLRAKVNEWLVMSESRTSCQQRRPRYFSWGVGSLIYAGMNISSCWTVILQLVRMMMLTGCPCFRGSADDFKVPSPSIPTPGHPTAHSTQHYIFLVWDTVQTADMIKKKIAWSSDAKSHMIMSVRQLEAWFLLLHRINAYWRCNFDLHRHRNVATGPSNADRDGCDRFTW